MFNRSNGVYVVNSKNTLVTNNHIGTMNGIVDAPNLGDGICVIGSSTGTVVGGDAKIQDGVLASPANIIASNKLAGIRFFGDSEFPELNPTGSVARGNYIGVGANGKTADGFGNGTGIIVEDASQITIGGAGASRNIISGNRGFGIQITGSRQISILNNAVGVGADGTTPAGNGKRGVSIDGQSKQLDAKDGNIVAHNGEGGMLVEGALVTIVLV